MGFAPCDLAEPGRRVRITAMHAYHLLVRRLAAMVLGTAAAMLTGACSQRNHWPDESLDPASAASESSPCSLMPKALAARKQGALRRLARSAQEVRELPDGYTIRFDGQPRTLRKVLGFVAFERGCCGSISLQVVVEPNSGPVWLTLRGDEDAKRFLSATIEELGLDTQGGPTGYRPAPIKKSPNSESD